MCSSGSGRPHILSLCAQREAELPLCVGSGGLVAFRFLCEILTQVSFRARRLAAIGEEPLGRTVARRIVVGNFARRGGQDAVQRGQVAASGPVDEVRAGRGLEDVFVELVGARTGGMEGLAWLAS